MIGLLLSALNAFKMILFWGLKKIPLLLEIPTLKDHLSLERGFKYEEDNLLDCTMLCCSVLFDIGRCLVHWFVTVR